MYSTYSSSQCISSSGSMSKMFLTPMLFSHVAIIVLILSVSETSATASANCEAARNNITLTKDNIFFTKKIPLVIGHRGNPMVYQENSLTGFKSLLDLNVDAFETDIFLTKDKKLVLFHDLNPLKLTGVQGNINNMTYEEIKKLNIKKQLVYGNRVFNYTKTEKIPLLEDLLREMKDSGILMILELKPSFYPDNEQSKETGRAVAKMVKEMGLEKQVILSSFDALKLYHARKEFDKLNVCFLVTKMYWDGPELLNYSKVNLEDIDGLKECVVNITAKDHGRFILESGTVCKAISASSLDMDIGIYNNPKYSNNTFEMFKKNYGAKFSYGAWTIYKMGLSEEDVNKSEAMVQMLIDNGVERFYTDDAPRLLKKLKRSIKRNSASSFVLFSTSVYVILSAFIINLR